MITNYTMTIEGFYGNMTGMKVETLLNSTNIIFEEDDVMVTPRTIVTTMFTSERVPIISSGQSNGFHRQIIIASLYLLAITGNLTALGLLFASKSAPRNPRLSLMLRCLAGNDLTAILGMSVQMCTKSLIPGLAHEHWFCIFRVVWRCFGLGSGCIVCIMAIDRWVALTYPFFYQRNITIGTIKKGIISLWLVNLVIVCLPLFGFGVYYNHSKGLCIRYKNAELPIDKAYAYLYLTFGLLLCTCLVMCNLAVIKVLVSPVNAKKKSAVLVRRISRNKDLTFNASTAEELAFAKVMGLLCFVFVVCWLPQLITVPIAQTNPRSNFYLNLGDAILAIHFVVDPYLYVLQRWSFIKTICSRKPNSRGNSVRTSNELCSL